MRYAVTIRKEGFVPLRLPDVAAPADRPLRVTLIAIGEVAGRLIDERGAPVPGATVALVRGTRTSRGLAGAGHLLAADARGRYRLDHLTPGPVTLQATAPGRLAAESADLALIAGGGLAIPDLVLRPGAVVEGRVSTADGRPAAGRRRGALRRRGPPGSRRRGLRPDPGARRRRARRAPGGGRGRSGHRSRRGGAGADGAYRAEALGPGAWSVTAILAGSARSLEGGVTLTPELPEARLDLDFGHLLALTGRVRVAGAVPAVAEVQLRSRGPGRFLGSSPVDADGAFRLGGVPPGSYTLEVVAAGARPLRRTLDLETDGDLTFDLPAPPPPDDNP